MAKVKILFTKGTAMNRLLYLMLLSSLCLLNTHLFACTNFLISKGASKDGSTMISYSADAHVMYGELYHWPAAKYPDGAMLDVYEWDSGKYLGKIRQVKETCNVIGNINEFQVSIGETTYGGRKELASQKDAIMDYGSMMYIGLQRSRSAREAIKVMMELVAEYGYSSTGESLSVADKNEVWLLEMIGKGEGQKGAVWVARRVPDGFICAHANQARITTFPLENGETSISSKNLDKIFLPGIECVYAEDVASFARSKGWYNGEDKDFSFSDTYAPVDFSGARFCEIRVWAMFRQVHKDMDKYGDYISGKNPKNRMPLWIEPERKISVQDMMAFMRDHLEGTEFDMIKDIGAGPYNSPYRWRPLTWKADNHLYLNERATATQQTGFSFIAQMRSWLPDYCGGILWFGVDDAASSLYVPIYCSVAEVPEAYKVGNGNMMTFSPTAAFWAFNQVSNFAYTRYRDMQPEIAKIQNALENRYVAYTPVIDKAAEELYKTNPELAVQFLNDYSVNTASRAVRLWQELYIYLFTKYMDGNIKTRVPGQKNPKVEQPGYGEAWYKRIAGETGDKLKVIGEGH
jgi:dipeptidase